MVMQASIVVSIGNIETWCDLLVQVYRVLDEDTLNKDLESVQRLKAIADKLLLPPKNKAQVIHEIHFDVGIDGNNNI